MIPDVEELSWRDELQGHHYEFGEGQLADMKPSETIRDNPLTYHTVYLKPLRGSQTVSESHLSAQHLRGCLGVARLGGTLH